MREALRSIVVCVLLVASVNDRTWAKSRPRPPWQTALAESLDATYAIARISFFNNRITQPGTIVVVQQDGLSGSPWDGGIGDNLIRDGKVQQKGRNWLYALEGSGSRNFKIGSKHYVHHLAVKDEEVQISLVTVDTYEIIEKGESKPSRFRAELHFQFAPGELDTMSFAHLRSEIDPLIGRESDLQKVKTVTLGQTREQVEAAMGKPETVLELGAKTVYVYPKLRLVFIDGKVADVE